MGEAKQQADLEKKKGTKTNKLQQAAGKEDRDPNQAIEKVLIRRLGMGTNIVFLSYVVKASGGRFYAKDQCYRSLSSTYMHNLISVPRWSRSIKKFQGGSGGRGVCTKIHKSNNRGLISLHWTGDVDF